VLVRVISALVLLVGHCIDILPVQCQTVAV